MPTTLYQYTDTASHCSANGPNVYAAGTQGNSDKLYVATSGSEMTNPTTFTRTTYATVSGTTYYLFAPSYTTVNNGGQGTPSEILFGESGDSPTGDAMYIHQDNFGGSNGVSHIDQNASSTSPQYIYLKLFDITSQGTTTSHNVLLSYTGTTVQQNLPWGGSDTHYVFNWVASGSDPVCLTDTCDILTPNGYVNVKDLSVGDLVTTPEGKDVKITKVMKPTTHVAMGKALPHFIPKNSLGENKPTKDTFISKNHAYNSGIPSKGWLCGQFNIGHNATNWDKDFVTYYNIMTEDYPKHNLVVNGVEMECWGGYEHNKPETHGNIKLRKEKLGFK